MRLLVPSALAFSLVLALACGGGGTTATKEEGAGATTTAPPPPPPPAPAPAATPTPAPATPAAPVSPPPAAQGPFTCCDNARVASVVDAYLDLQVALAKDDNQRVGAVLSKLQGNADAAKSKGGVDEKSTALLTTIRTKAHEGLTTAKDIEGRRKLFLDISTATIELAKKHKGGTGKSVTEAHCPMYPGSWLQEGTTIANPYYGSKMLTCGSFK